MRTRDCDACHGTGGYHGIMGGPDSPRCPRCNGTGYRDGTTLPWRGAPLMTEAAIRTAVEQEIALALRTKAQWHDNYAAEIRDTDMELAKTHKSIAHTTNADADFVGSGAYRKDRA